MRTALWLIWFFVSRKIAYLMIFGVWLFAGILCLVGGPGRPAPPDIWALYWLLGTIALIPLVIWYTIYNIGIFIRKVRQGSIQLVQFAHRELRKG
ncbi:hypothetical protein [Microvirga calopogonii]|uniref:hypothetical protein n=1 Tax=Microvirga calopogonii TaxID=2078013 RepID=UPI000E0CD0D0|nr:hypothetical protein [Microvirga calopogonii]